MDTLILSYSDVSKIVNSVGTDTLMDEMIASLATAFANHHIEHVATPPRTGFAYDSPGEGMIEWMPAHEQDGEVTMKIVGYHPNNPKNRGLPTILSTISSYDSATGHLTGLADATLLTAMRTGAASAVASTLLAKADSSTVGLVGCGVQAVTQLHGLSRRFDIGQVLAYDVNPDCLASFRRRVETVASPLPHVEFTTAESVVARSDIVCTSTSVGVGEGPVFKDTSTRDWLHINAVGSDFPGKFELPVSLLRRSVVFPDFPAQAMVEGECQQLEPDAVGPSITHLSQNPSFAESMRDRLTVFDSTGWALADHVTMKLIFEHARERGLGQKVAIEANLVDPFSPYSVDGSGGIA